MSVIWLRGEFNKYARASVALPYTQLIFVKSVTQRSVYLLIHVSFQMYSKMICYAQNYKSSESIKMPCYVLVL